MTTTIPRHERQVTNDRRLTPILPEEGLVVRVVGLGGIGGIVARNLSIFLATLRGDAERRLVLIDGDTFERRNASRMLFSLEGNKAEVTRADLLQHFVDSSLTLLAMDEYITPENITRLLPGGVGETVILSVDNHATRKLVSDYCEGKDGWPGLENICLISGGNDPVGLDSEGRLLRGAYGNCQVYLRRGGQDITPSLTTHHAEIEHPTDRLPTAVGCVEKLDSAPQLLFANLMAASTICNAFWLCLCDVLHYGEVVFDIFEGQMRPVSIGRPNRSAAHESPSVCPPRRAGIQKTS